MHQTPSKMIQLSQRIYISSSPPRPDRLWGPLASCPMGTRSSFYRVKRPGREAEHSPPSSAKVKECVKLYFHSPNTLSWRGA